MFTTLLEANQAGQSPSAPRPAPMFELIPYEKFRDRATKILAARNGEADKVASSTNSSNGGAK